MRSSVDLPHPDGPTNTTKLPCSISRSTPWITSTASKRFTALASVSLAMGRYACAGPSQPRYAGCVGCDRQRRLPIRWPPNDRARSAARATSARRPASRESASRRRARRGSAGTGRRMPSGFGWKSESASAIAPAGGVVGRDQGPGFGGHRIRRERALRGQMLEVKAQPRGVVGRAERHGERRERAVDERQRADGAILGLDRIHARRGCRVDLADARRARASAHRARGSPA